MNRLEPYNEGDLFGMPTKDLRGKVRAEHAAGNLTTELLLSHGIRAHLVGSDIASLRGETCISILLGKMNGSPIQPAQPIVQTETIAPAPSVVASDAPNASLANQMAALLTQAIGGVNPETIKIEIARQMEAPIASFNGKLATSQEKVEAAIAVFTKWQADAQKSVDTLRAEMLAGRSVKIEIVKADGEVKAIGRQHYLFPLLLAIAQARCHAYLVGPAGSGKTSICHKVADALSLPFYALSVCQQSTQSNILGYMNATGDYVRTCFREAFEHGGVFVLDEVDNGNANVIAVLNAALANDSMSFPDGMIKRHADFILIAAGNTYGTGADRLYVGRNQLDAATLDRFCFLDFPYDEGFEAELCGVMGVRSPACDVAKGGTVTADDWLAFVGKVRKACEALKLRHVVSPRASIYGVKLAKAGIGRAWLESMLIFKGLDAEQIKKVKASL